MSEKQHPIGSGFTAASTADEVLHGIDLSGTNVVVTGGHVGLGLETTRALSKAGASVTVGARNPGPRRPALAGIERVEIGQLDLLDPTSIDAFAARYVDSGRPLHILINNAGIMGGELVRDARGYESQFATNHLGHFQLTQGLLPALRAAARRPRRQRVIRRPSTLRHPLGRPAFHHRVRRHARLRPVQDRQCPVRRRVGSAMGRRGNPRLRRAPRHRVRHEPGAARSPRTSCGRTGHGADRRVRPPDHRPRP